ncbi:MAG: hypothetical protein ACI8PZ_003224 [Myxococcota bacterium]|jgi:hypothetical protein
MRAVMVLWVLAACAGAPSSPDAGSAQGAPGFLQAARAVVPAPFEGAATRVVSAGAYTYIEVHSGDEHRWVVTLQRDVGLGDPLWVRPYGQLDDFASSKTGLTFDRLIFAVVTPRSV